MPEQIQCPVCGSKDTREFFEQNNVACQDGVLWNTKRDALNASRGNIGLFFCKHCLYIGNNLYDPSLVKFEGYDISLQHSPSFQQFTDDLAAKLIYRYNIRGKTVLEIGCGKGDFLKTICRLGKNEGVGFDPSFVDDRKDWDGSDITFFRDYYSEEYGRSNADLIVCRQVLDILVDPKTFLSMVRRSIGNHKDTVVYFEVFDAEKTLRNLIVWNVIYEHRSWFVPESLSTLFKLCGFSVINIMPCWNEEYIGIEAVPADRTQKVEANPAALARMESHLKKFVNSYTNVLALWKQNLLDLKQYRVAAWGAGARGITFLSANDWENKIPIVDINPKRQGKYLPITGHKVEPPEALRRYRPEILIITNPTYSEEIKGQAEQMGLTCQFMVL